MKRTRTLPVVLGLLLTGGIAIAGVEKEAPQVGTSLAPDHGHQPLDAEASTDEASDSAATPDLSGMWKINAEASDDPREKMREAMMAGMAHGKMGGKFGGPTGGPGSPGDRPGTPGTIPGGPGSGGPRREMQGGPPVTGGPPRTASSGGPMSNPFAGIELLIIRHSEPAIEIGYGEEMTRKRTLTTDGEPVSHETPRGLESEITANWDGARLDLTTTTERRSVRESYELSPDGKRLSVTVRMESPRFGNPIIMVRVYDRDAAKGEEEVTAAE